MKYLNKLYHSGISLLFLLSILSGFFTTSCQKAPINGDLDGQWEVVDVHPMAPKVTPNQRFFYNFSLQVCALTFYGEPFMNGNMVYDGESLWLDFPFADTEKENQTLKEFGILSNPVTFNVDFKDSHNLILSNDDSTVVLVKH